MADSPWVRRVMRWVRQCEIRAEDVKFYSRCYPHTVSHQAAILKHDVARRRLRALLREKEEK